MANKKTFKKIIMILWILLILSIVNIFVFANAFPDKCYSVEKGLYRCFNGLIGRCVGNCHLFNNFNCYWVVSSDCPYGCIDGRSSFNLQDICNPGPSTPTGMCDINSECGYTCGSTECGSAICCGSQSTGGQDGNSYCANTCGAGSSCVSNNKFHQPICTSGGGGSGCFPAGTQISMEDGSTKNIEDIKPGDKVLGVDLEIVKDESNIFINNFFGRIIELLNKRK
jgi:hypothetical protein